MACCSFWVPKAVLLSAIRSLERISSGTSAHHKLVSALAGWPTLLSTNAVIGGFLFSAAVGIFFGYYQARKASLLITLSTRLSSE